MAETQDTRPLHEQIAADLRARIMSGQIDGTLPSMSLLMEDQPTNSKATMQRAIALLRDEGLIESRQGASTRVRTEQVRHVVAGAHVQPDSGDYRFHLLDVAEAEARGDVASALLIPPGELAVVRTLLIRRRRDDTPVELVHLYFPKKLAQATALAEKRPIKGGVAAVLTELGVERMPDNDVVTTRPPTTGELKLLELPVTVPVLRSLRVYRSADGKPVEVDVMVNSGHLVELRYALPDH